MDCGTKLMLIFLPEILCGLTDRKLLVSIQILNFFCSGLAHWLDEFKMVEADDGYIEEVPQKVESRVCIESDQESSAAE